VGLQAAAERKTKEGVLASSGKQRVVLTSAVRHKPISKGQGSKRKSQRARPSQEIQTLSTQNAAKVNRACRGRFINQREFLFGKE
jgi:hypothetical protein